jgi:hypothetical protein
VTNPTLLRITRVIVGRRASGFVQVAKCFPKPARAVENHYGVNQDSIAATPFSSVSRSSRFANDDGLKSSAGLSATPTLSAHASAQPNKAQSVGLGRTTGHKLIPNTLTCAYAGPSAWASWRPETRCADKGGDNCPKMLQDLIIAVALR